MVMVNRRTLHSVTVSSVHAMRPKSVREHLVELAEEVEACAEDDRLHVGGRRHAEDAGDEVVTWSPGHVTTRSRGHI